MADSIASARVKRELREFQSKGNKSGISGITLELEDGANLMKLKGTIDGPPDTPYQGGQYNLTIEIPSTYPFNPPRVKFVTPLWHPNVSSVTGAICLDILASRWAAAMTLRTVLLSIQALLESPEPDDPQDAVVAAQYNSNRRMWEATALYWAQLFAAAPGNPNPQFKAAYDKICQMGFEKQKGLASLSQHNWDTEAALQYLFN